MLDLLASVIATTIEGTCIFVLTLNLFRFKAREHIVAIGVANLIVSVTNYSMKIYNFYYDYSPLINIVILILVLIIMFKVSLLDSIIMAAVGFVASLVIQAIIILMFTVSNRITLQQLRLEDVKYVLQIISGLAYVGVSYLLNQKHWWFTFIPFKRSFRFNLSRLNIGILSIFLVLLVVLGLVIKFDNVLLITLISLLLLFTMIYFTMKKEKQYD